TKSTAFDIPSIFSNLLINNEAWELIGPLMESVLPTYVTASESYPAVHAMLSGNLEAFSEAMFLRGALMDAGIAQAFKTKIGTEFTREQLQSVIANNLSGLDVAAVRSGIAKSTDAIWYGVEVGGETVTVSTETIVAESLAITAVEGAAAVETAVVGFTAEEAIGIIIAILLI
ncbi:3066_t:CDS:2, partial [Diversispora eburnea]